MTDLILRLYEKTAQQVDAPETYAPDKSIVVLTRFARSAATMLLSSASVPVIFDVGQQKKLGKYTITFCEYKAYNIH
jgi:hypothetical protein